MGALVILRAAIVSLITFAALGHLRLTLPCDRRAAVGTLDQVAGVSKSVGLVDLLAICDAAVHNG